MKRKPIEREGHSDEVQEIMNSRLPFVVRWGMTVVAAVMAAVIASLFLLDLPDGLSDFLQSVATGLKWF